MSRRPVLFVLFVPLVILFSNALSAAPAQAPAAMLGFDAPAAAAQVQRETEFDQALNADHLRDWLKSMSSQPNHLGSPHDKANAEFVLAQFRQWGWDAQIEVFDVLFPTPKERVLEMLGDNPFRAVLDEPSLPEDASSQKRDGVLPPYNAYSADGDATAQLVYVNFGIPQDYEELERRGISVKGKIAIARYGHSWRGIKPKVAQEHGAVGCIIYSDPHEDGFFEGQTYPQGAFRGELGTQRGSVADMPLYAGDPLTPGVGATKNAKRLKREEAKDLPKIPVLPISYADALPLLKSLEGPVAPAAWRGALPITYRIGPSSAQTHLKLKFDWKLTPAYDVVAKLRGSRYPDQWVLRGNHRDGWVFGANDPLSGQVAMLEEARVLGAMHKNGWNPERTIVYLSWDGEEPGLLGSTEWAETHADELKAKAVVYINTDSNGRGFLDMGGSHSLERLINEVAAGVVDPQTKVSVLARRRAQAAVANAAQNKPIADPTHDLALEALGSGSDFTPFLQHLGIPAINLGFSGESDAGNYHSLYDTYEHYVRFGDPNFEYGIALAQTVGHSVLRLADAPLLPLRFSNFASTVGGYLDELKRLTEQMRTSTEAGNRLIAEEAYVLAADRREISIAPKIKPVVPHLNFAPLENALEKLKASADAYDRAVSARGTPLDANTLRQLNGKLQGMEGLLMRADGLPGRPWYRHMIYAPGLYTGYGVKTLPGVREAIEQRRWDEAELYVRQVAAILEGYSAQLDKMSVLLN